MVLGSEEESIRKRIVKIASEKGCVSVADFPDMEFEDVQLVFYEMIREGLVTPADALYQLIGHTCEYCGEPAAISTKVREGGIWVFKYFCSELHSAYFQMGA